MSTRALYLSGSVGAFAVLLMACSAAGHGGDDQFAVIGGEPTSGGSGSGSGGGGDFNPSTGSSMSTSSGTGCAHDPNTDGDNDGWTGAQGDCNDCDPNVNPGAIDTGHDEDCNGKMDPPVACDSGIAIDSTDPMNGAKAIELCQTASASNKNWGVLSAAYVRANGSPAPNPGVQVGILDSFGPNTHVQAGQRMLGLSSGAARSEGQPGACGQLSCGYGPGTPPAGFPQDVPSCAGAKNINDDIALELQIRAPTNATGYKFNFKFYSFEFPFYVCSPFNDQFIALVNPAPAGSINGNISFDSMKNPVSVNLAFFDVCDPSDQDAFGAQCQMTNGACPSPPNPYCPSGPSQLDGTGFETWGGEVGDGNSGATSWLETAAPVKGGDTVTIRYAIWDTGDTELDSTVLVDNFRWVANGGMVSIGTAPATNPK